MRGKAVNTGTFHDTLYLQEKVVSGQNSMGEDEFEWRDVLRVRAHVMDARGRELEAMQQRFAEAQYAITTHYVPRVEWVHDRSLLWGEQRLNILGINDLAGDRRFIAIYAKEYVD